MNPVPYGSSLAEPDLRQIVAAQSEQMKLARGDLGELKELARRLNVKYETEQKRLRQLQEEIALANVRTRNISFQNEDLRQRLQHIEVHGIEQRHVHTVKLKQPIEGVAVTVVGIAAIIGMLLMMLYAVATTV